MAVFKIDFLFNQLNRGFSETWYMDTADIQTAMASAKSVAKLRSLTCARDVAFEAIRVSDVAVNGDSLIFTDTTTYAQPDRPGDVTAVGILVRCMSGTTYRKPLVLRGLPDDWLDRSNTPGKILLNDVGKKPVKAYLQAVITAGWRFRCRPKVTDLADYSPITAVAAVGGNVSLTAVSCAAVAAIVHTGYYIQIRGCRKSAAALNGVWNVQDEPVSPVIHIGLNFVGHLSFLQSPDWAKAKARYLLYTYQSMSDYTILDGRTRKSGKAFFVPAGRSRRRL